MARGSARAGRDCVAFLVSLIPDRAASFSLVPSLPPPLTTRPYYRSTLTFSTSDSFLLLLRSSLRWRGRLPPPPLDRDSAGPARAALTVPSRPPMAWILAIFSTRVQISEIQKNSFANYNLIKGDKRDGKIGRTYPEMK